MDYDIIYIMDNINVIEKKQFYLDSIAKFCDKCGNAYSLDDLNILQSSGASAIIHFSCHICKSKHIASYVSSNMGMSSRVPINTDLSIDEIRKFSKKEVLSLQNILDLYVDMKKRSKVVL